MARPSERTLLFLVGAVQFVNVLDFMMVMPLGPDFAAGLGIPLSQLGLVGGSYTAAAAVAGIAGASFLDRFDRRSALGAAMVGLVVGTVAGGFARGLASMILARSVAGAFGGPATALAIAIVTDAVPPERRGKALGKVMGAFTVASVLGVPAGLEVARLGGWRAPFFAVAALGLLVAGAAIRLMPPLRGHLGARAAGAPRPISLARNPTALFALAATAASMASGFAIIPNIASWAQFNLGLPRERLGLLYMAGGAVTFFTLRLAGRMIDRFGATAVATLGTAVFVANLAVGFAWAPAGLPVVPIFVAFMVGNSTRNVSASTLSTRVPAPEERARYLSAQSAVQHLAAAAGAALSTRILTELPDGRLAGMGRLVLFSSALSVALPVLLAAVSRRLAATNASTKQEEGAFLAPGGEERGGSHVSVSDWIRQFRALHLEAVKGTLNAEELQAYRGACDEFARALMAAQKKAARPGEPPRHALRVPKALQVELESAMTLAKAMTLELGVGGFSAILPKAPKLGDEFSCRLRLPGGDPLETTLVVSEVKPQPGSVRVSFDFPKLSDATKSRIETVVIDAALAQVAA